MKQFLRLSIIVTSLCVLGACVLVPVGPRRVYYGPAVAPVGVVVVHRY